MASSSRTPALEGGEPRLGADAGAGSAAPGRRGGIPNGDMEGDRPECEEQNQLRGFRERK